LLTTPASTSSGRYYESKEEPQDMPILVAMVLLVSGGLAEQSVLYLAMELDKDCSDLGGGGGIGCSDTNNEGHL